MLRQKSFRILLTISLFLAFSSVTVTVWADTNTGLNHFGQICQNEDVEIITIEPPPDTGTNQD